MKKLFLFFALGILILTLVPAQKFSADWWEDQFNKNPEKAWQEFEDDPSLWESQTASEIAFRIDPARASIMINQELSKQYSILQNIQLDQEDFWIKDSLTGILDKEIQESPDLLNENIFLKREWFAKKGISDEGGEIENYDGKIVQTRGAESTKFDITDEIFKESRILPSGKLVLKDGSEIKNSEVLRVSGRLNFHGGQIDLSSLSELDFDAVDSEVKIGDKIYLGPFGEKFKVSRVEGFTQIEGKEIFEKDTLGNVLSKFTGKLKTNGHKILGDNTRYTLISRGQDSREYLVERETALYSESDKCLNAPISCIEDIGSNIKISAKEDNQISLDNFDRSISNLEIEKIDDGSSVIFNDEDEARLIFTKDPVKLEGNFAKLSASVKSSYIDKKGKLNNLVFEHGTITNCMIGEPCVDFSLNSIVGPQIAKIRDDEIEGDKFLIGVREKYGDQARLYYLDYLVVEKNPRIYKAAISASQKIYENSGVEVSPEFIYVGAVSEGLDQWIFNKLKIAQDLGLREAEIYMYQNIDTFDAFGLNFAVTDEDLLGLKKDSYLPQNFGLSGARKVENIEDGFLLSGAEYARFRTHLFNDLNTLGIESSKMSKEALDFWNYVYYNCCAGGSPKEMLELYKNKGYLKNDDYIWKRPDESYKVPHRYANRRMANLKLLEEAGIVFPKK